MMRSILFFFGGFLAAANLAIAKEEGNATGFRFRGPEVVKIDWNARALHAVAIHIP